MKPKEYTEEFGKEINEMLADLCERSDLWAEINEHYTASVVLEIKWAPRAEPYTVRIESKEKAVDSFWHYYEKQME